MTTRMPNRTPLQRTTLRRHFAAAAVAAVTAAAVALPAAAIDLADAPPYSSVSVPGNLILALSVEWPTATTPAYPSTTAYSADSTFLGYFDPAKCYRYVARDTGTAAAPDWSTSYFEPHSAAKDHRCTSSAGTALWSGNYLNWASMQTLDAFRWVLTGGYRSVDTTTDTVLTKTYAAVDSKSRMPEKAVGAGALDGATPFSGSKWTAGMTTRLRNLGTRMWFTSANTTWEGTGTAGWATSGAVPYTGQTSAVAAGSPGHADPAVTYEVFINVKVCDAKVGLEDNCVAYGKNHKPEGLMQKHSSSLRYSAFGYYNDSNGLRDGGVMRARMKYIGPTRPVPGAPSTTNEHPEWDAATGVMLNNPDPADAGATADAAKAAGWEVAIANSGVMNYLNKFGYGARSYKSFDPVSEMYYAAQRYFRGLGNVDAYTSLRGASASWQAGLWLDGFPAVTSDEVWKGKSDPYGSPMLYSCQKNFILGIGDVNTHRDGNLPGSVQRSKLEPNAQPPEVAADTSVDVKKATDMVGRLEGLKGDATLGELFIDTRKPGPCEGGMCNTFQIAGLAYDAHTVDIRPDLPGMQTIDTYWMDVLEEQQYGHKNQYWLAAKYGGFTVPEGFDPYATGNSAKTLSESSWRNNKDALVPGAYMRLPDASTDSGDKDPRPDNYFPGDRPETMKSGLTRAFEAIVAKSSAATGTALGGAPPDLPRGEGLNYATKYEPKDWSGDLLATTLRFDRNGVPKATQEWSAAALLDALVGTTDTSARRVVTCCDAQGRGLPFTADALSKRLVPAARYKTFAAVPGVETQSAADYVAWLRGARGQEIGRGGRYRARSSVLGDIVDSEPAVVGAPDARLLDANNPGYSDFKRRYAKRRKVVYVGANDGMLHAFDGTAGKTASGRELFAYVPGALYREGSDAAERGLAALGNPAYRHRFFVNATPYAVDVDLSRTGPQKQDATEKQQAQKEAKPDWRTLLIGGLGKGGRGYYALDVTNPKSWDSEDDIAGKVMWEFADDRLGYSYGAPSLVKTRKYGWTVVFTSGYDNADGKGWFFFVNPRTGALFEAVAAPEGSTAEPLNLAHHSLYVPDMGDYTADAVYAGDLRGNLWRVDLTGDSEAYPAPVKIAVLTNEKGSGLPVTTRPLIEIDPATQRRYVMVGTGRLLGNSDLLDAERQAFYAIVDGKQPFGAFYASGAPGVGFPFRRASLAANADVTKGIGSTKSNVGWYVDLGLSNGIAKRVDVQPTASQGTVAFAANVPNGEVCNPEGSGEALIVAFGSGRSVLVDADTGLVAASIVSTRRIRDIEYKRVQGSIRIYTGDSGGTISKVPTALPGSGALRWIGWREVSPRD